MRGGRNGVDDGVNVGNGVSVGVGVRVGVVLGVGVEVRVGVCVADGAGVRVAAAVGFVGAIFSEMLASKSGLGNLLTKAAQLYKTGDLFAIILVVTLLSVLVIHLIDLVEKRFVLRWKYKKSSK